MHEFLGVRYDRAMAALSAEKLNDRLIAALGVAVREHGPLKKRPLEVDLAPPLPQRIRAYVYTLTCPPGGRPLDECKIQLTVAKRGQRGSFDDSAGRIPLLLGYSADEDVFVLWDAELMTSFGYSRSVQVKTDAIVEALAGKIARQSRLVQPEAKGKRVEMIVLAAQSRRLADAIRLRMEITRARLQQD